MTAPLLSVRNLRTYFKSEESLVKAVDDVSFQVGQGETLGIVGESGCGKTVANLSILRLVPQPPGFYAGGEILYAGKDLLSISNGDIRKIRGDEISMIFQDPMTSLNPFLTIGRQLTEVLEQHRKMSRGESRHRAIEMLSRVGIPFPERRLQQYPHQFSGGMRQRVMIAMALLCEPKLLIADEPTTALDVTIQSQILSIISDLQKELKMAVILITHDLGVVAGVTDRVAVMYAGKIVEEGTTEEIFAEPQHPYTKGLLQSIPRLDEEVAESLVPIVGMPPDLSELPDGCPFAPRCSSATEKCQTQYPGVTTMREGRWASCWNLEDGA